MRYQKFEDYRKAWDAAPIKDPPVPLNVDIELASLCNLKCPFCFIPDPSFEKFISQKSSDGLPLKRVMPKEMAFKIIDQCAWLGVPALKFNWRGESTLHPHYSGIVTYAKTKKVFLDLLCNSNMNFKDHALMGVFNCTKIMCSIDSMKPETYYKMRVGGELALALSNIQKLIDLGHKNIWVRRVIAEENKHENFKEDVEKVFKDKVFVSEHYCFDRNKKSSHEPVGCDHDTIMNRTYCGYPSQRLVISSTGNVYPCCIDLHETMPLGNINRNTLTRIWHSNRLKVLREVLRENRTESMSKACHNCESWMAFNAPQRRFVQDVKK